LFATIDASPPCLLLVVGVERTKTTPPAAVSDFGTTAPFLTKTMLACRRTVQIIFSEKNLSDPASVLLKRASVLPPTAPLAAASAPPSPVLVRSYTTHAHLPEEHRMVYEMCRNFADSELAPNAGDWDQKHEFPREAITKLVRAVLQQCLVES
jgi:Acyl-CoA dehydrogenase, N-terminal domain